MGRDDFRYSAQLQVNDEWCWFLETNELGDAKHHVRCRINKNPELNGRVVDKKTGETVFIDPDPNALKIRFRREDDEDWQRLEITYVDEKNELLVVRDGSDFGVWLSLNQVHPDDVEAVKKFGASLERRQYTEEQSRRLAQVYDLILSFGHKEEKEKKKEEEARRNAAYEGMSYEDRLRTVYEKWQNDELPLSEMTEREMFYWQQENTRRRQKRENLLWNCENHSFFIKRVKALYDHLSVEEKQAIEDLLEEKKWGDKELAQVKEIIETAQWFSKMQSQFPESGNH